MQEHEETEEMDQQDHGLENKVLGRPLFAAFAARCHELGMMQDEGATQIGISASYLRALAKGSRNLMGVPFQTFVNFARFIGKTVPQTLLLAEVLEPKDFIVEEDLDGRFKEMMRHISADPEFGPLFAKETSRSMMGLNDDAKIAVMLIYERAYRTRLLQQARPVEKLHDKT